MDRGLNGHWRRLALLLGCLLAALATRADPLDAVRIVRDGGCGGTMPRAKPLQRNAALDRAAHSWADGMAVGPAAGRSGYRSAASTALHIRGPEPDTIQLLESAGCGRLADPSLRDIGIYRRGPDTWLLLASAYATPDVSEAPVLAGRALQLVNDARARGARCGTRGFGPAPPVSLSGTLAVVAYGHAKDMAVHAYFEHEDRAGRTPAERVRATGYREKLVGENIAYGPRTAEEVVQGWLDSPGHCENIMDPRFAEMGIAFAPGQSSKHGLYWVQLLAAPRT